MQIRKATPEDKAAIIGLLKQSLGESTIPKSEQLWSWKHEQNPFGYSYVLVAEKDDMLIGLRAFMQWDWQWEGRNYKAIRAVDTATHPDHQGKGIFKKLTLEQAEICKQEGVDFIFNTPNTQSKPGYVKMGWIEQGKMPLKFKLLRPYSIAYGKIFDKKKYLDQKGDPSPVQQWNDEVLNLFSNYSVTKTLITTCITREYISWRYAYNPLFRYNFFTDKKNYVLISRVKQQAFTRELRLVDFILLNPEAGEKYLSSSLKKEVIRFCTDHRIDFISLSGQQFKMYRQFFNWMGIIPVKALGPTLTIKDLNMNDKFPALLDVKHWGYSLGDLELF